MNSLDLSADLFDYPNESWLDKYECFLGEKLKISLADLEALYINYFSLHSQSYKTTPLASYWLDGKAMGKSNLAISNFYENCGYAFKDFGMCDHISTMLGFCAILLEENKKNEFEDFKKYLVWLFDFKVQIKAYEDLAPFVAILDKTMLCLNMRRENA